MVLSILESTRHKLRIAYGLTLVTPSLRGWEAFPTLGALIHIMIVWALSPTALQVSGVNLGSSLCPWCFGHLSWRSTQHSPPPNGVDALIEYTRSQNTNSQVSILYGAALCLPWGATHTMHLHIWHISKGVVPRWSSIDLGSLLQGPSLY